jgi:hypothetical protein
VEEAICLAAEGGAVAAQAVGLDVAALMKHGNLLVPNPGCDCNFNCAPEGGNYLQIEGGGK